MTAQWHEMKNQIVSAAILLRFKLCVRLIEVMRFAETNSAHAELIEDLFPW